MPRNKKKQSKSTKPETHDGSAFGTMFMLPTLHDNVVNMLNGVVAPEPWFNPLDSDDVYEDQDYKTHIIGKFQCPNKQCRKRSWRSGQVAIRIRGYEDGGYNAVVFNQRCRDCNTLGALMIDQTSYVERVTYRLKRWAGEPPENHYYHRVGREPHEREFCEGCKLGFCGAGRGTVTINQAVVNAGRQGRTGAFNPSTPVPRNRNCSDVG